MADVVARAAHRDRPDLLTCTCGGQWFDVLAVCLSNDLHVTGWAAPLTCRNCGKEKT